MHGKLKKGHKQIEDKFNSYFISIGEREAIEEPHQSNFTNHQVQDNIDTTKLSNFKTTTEENLIRRLYINKTWTVRFLQ